MSVNDVVLSSRVRLARNIYNTPFPHKLTGEGSQQVINTLAGAVAKSPEGSEFTLTFLKDNSPVQNQALVEKHLISLDLTKNAQNAAVLINKREDLSLMIGEEDHLRIQAILDGLSIDEAYEKARAMDALLSTSVRFAYDDDFGYITACPTNLGTGMRASCMMHLPGLTMAGQIEALSRTLARIGFTVRGFYGEGTKAYGSIYQLSNQVTLGKSEQELLTQLKETAQQVIARERGARRLLLEKNGIILKDRLLRSFGVLRYAAKLTSKELLQLWSETRFAVSENILTEIDTAACDRLLSLQSAQLALRQETPSDLARDMLRAKLVKKILDEAGMG